MIKILQFQGHQRRDEPRQLEHKQSKSLDRENYSNPSLDGKLRPYEAVVLAL
jgi:hypothetical protein